MGVKTQQFFFVKKKIVYVFSWLLGRPENGRELMNESVVYMLTTSAKRQTTRVKEMKKWK